MILHVEVEMLEARKFALRKTKSIGEGMISRKDQLRVEQI
jgi:hypothetical protein